jgi:hypothetical protein
MKKSLPPDLPEQENPDFQNRLFAETDRMIDEDLASGYLTQQQKEPKPKRPKLR